ncbi:cytidylate kinase family protein [Candidatus Marsarchaeota archaeon]|jgi:cytidylate kinase|nr:cytidylate kinase family protein [Candidatus Marsarchaeota archaeon]
MSDRLTKTKSKKPAVVTTNLPIVIVGPPGSGKSTLGNLLSILYNTEVYSVGRKWRDQYKKEYPNNDITFEDYWKSIPEADQLEANKNLKHYAQDLHCIIDTRYPQIFDKDKCLIVYLDAPLGVRVKRVAGRPEYSGKNSEEISTILSERERAEAAIGKKLFGTDYRDPNFYHLILDSGLLTPEEEVSAIDAKMRELKSLIRRER